MDDLHRLLVVRRDNIGDLVCTTPLLRALRMRFPRAWIGALVNSYNAPVLDRNPDLDAVYAYTKLKHLEDGQSPIRALLARGLDLWGLRRKRLDAVVLATPAFSRRTLRLARWLAPMRLVGFSDGSPAARALDLSVPQSSVDGRHEVERVFALARLFGIDGDIPPLRLVPDPAEVERARVGTGVHDGRPKIAVHISARRPAQRWPVERFAELIGLVHSEYGATPILLWSPGPSNHPRHPGDDDKANAIRERVGDRAPIVGYPTERLAELIGVLATCDAMVCADGGAMHVAAALGKPIVALFGDSPPERWRPWGVAHRVLRTASCSVQDIGTRDVLEALGTLFDRGTQR